ncbi:Ig-like domain-containing protein [Coraliomargarita sp. W4R53]
MITSRSFWKRFSLAAITTAMASTVFAAGEPDADNDSVTAFANSGLNITDSVLLANDSGDGIDVVGPVTLTSSGGATLTRNSNSITYDPTGVAQYQALDSGDDVNDTFDYTIAGDKSPASSGDERATVTVEVNGVNDAPTISSLDDADVDDDETIQPFAGETIGDVDSGETLTVSVTIDPASDGVFSVTSGFSLIAPGDYRRTGNATQVTNALRALVFTPTKDFYPVDAEEDVRFTVLVYDGDATVNDSLDLTVTSINDNPAVAPASLSAANLFSGAIVSPFATVTLDELDVIVPETSEGATTASDQFTATVTLAGGANSGTLSTSSFATSNGLDYTYTATIDLVELAIKTLEYSAPGVSGSFTATLSLEDPNGGVSNSLIYSVTVTAPISGVAGIIQNQQVADNGTLNPFSTLVFNSFGSVDKEVSITLDDDLKGELELLSPFVKTGLTYTMMGDAIEATEAIQNLRFRPTANRIALMGSQTFEVTSFTINVAGVNVTDGAPIDVRVVPINDAPTIGGITTTIRVNDNDPVNPFAGVAIADVDESGLQDLEVTVSFIGEDVATGLPLAGGGTLANLTYNSTGSDSITFSGTPAEVQTILRDLTFTPDPSRNPVGERETVSFTLTVSDNQGGVALNDSTDVIVTSVNGAPFIQNIPDPSQQPFPIAASADLLGVFTALPFERLSVDDEDNITFQITFDSARGSLSTDDFTQTSAGVYDLASTDVATATTALQTLEFTASDDPAGLVQTTFTLTASDGINTVTRTLSIVLRERNLSHIVTSAADSGAGTLREAIDNAGNNDFIVFDFPNDAFPVEIELLSTLEIDKNITIVGSGVAELSISGGGSVALFSVLDASQFVIERITLKDGFSPSFGGAIAVDMDSSLVARYCSFENNSAGQYGGAIDVFLGQVVIENCLFAYNSIEGSEARGGGAVSIYSSGEATIRNSTFYGNLQGYEVGSGGAGVYVENADLALELEVLVEHCTFFNNVDASFNGSAIHSKNTGAKVQVWNNIFAGLETPLDEFDQPIPQGNVIEVSNGGGFVSFGGNISPDDTVTTYTQPNGRQNVKLLDTFLDLINTDAKLLPLADNGGITLTCDLDPSSPAIDSSEVAAPSVSSTGIDQRGYWRDATPDIGAVEADSFERININEIYVNLATGASPFIELYVPRDSIALNLQDLELYIESSLVETFGSVAIEPGAGTVFYPTTTMNPEKGSIELRNDMGQVLLSVDYVGSFAEEGDELDTVGESMTRYALYEGGLLPHQRIVERVTGVAGGGRTSPGDDVTGALLGGGNAPPIAVVDVDDAGLSFYAINADETLRPDILVNDIEFDRADIIKITEFSEVAAGSTVNQELFAVNGSGVIALTDLPLSDAVNTDSTYGSVPAALTIDSDGLGLLYDPTASDDYIGLALGESVTDLWAYTIRDFDAASPATARARGANSSEQEDNIIRATTYFAVTVTGVNEAPIAALDNAVTFENQAIRLLGDSTLIGAPFSFGDLPDDFMEFTATGESTKLVPPAPVLAILANDDDVDSDDDNTSIRLLSIHTTATPGDLLVVTSELGAAVTLDLRAERRETNILYDPRGSETLDALAAGEIATDRFFYSVVDRHGARSVGEVTITVTGVNDKPTASDDTGYVANEDETLLIDGSELLANDTDPDQDGNGPDDLPVILNDISTFPTTSLLGATITFDGTNITYDPTTMSVYEALARNETIEDSFVYTIDDGALGIDTAVVTVIVEGENDAPIAADDQLDIFENQTLFVSELDPNGLLTNDIEVDINNTTPDDDPWVIPQREVTTPLGAALDINPDGSYRYDANSPAIDSLYEGEVTTEVFPYTVIDNFRTTASNDAFTVAGNRSDVVLPVLVNDAVVGTTPIAVATYAEDAGDAGIVILESANHALRDGLVIQIQGYVGAGNYDGDYAVEVIDRDHFSITAPFVEDVTATLGTWRPWFEITSLTAGNQGGTLSSSDGQTVSYTPLADFYGTETFTYTIQDGVGGQDVGTVSVEVQISPFNGILDSQGESFRIGMGLENVVVDVLANDHTLPALGSALTITSVTASAGATGTALISDGGSTLTYTPPSPSFVGSETFIYEVSGGGSSTSIAEVTFMVEDRTDLLTGSDDAFFVVTGSTDNVFAVLVNDADQPSFPVSSSIIDVTVPASGGSATIVGDTILYTPPSAPFLGVESFDYTAQDSSGATTTQTVRVEVVAAAVDFFARNDNYRVVANSGPILLPILLNDGAVLNESAVISVEDLGLDTDSPPDVSRVIITPGGLFIQYTPPASATTEDFNYEIQIGTIDRREAKVTIEVVDAFGVQPNAVADAFSVEKNGTAVSLNVLANDLPYPDAGWTWTIATADSSGSAGGSIAIDADSALSYTPAPGYVGIETFEYTISDSFGATDTATVRIDVGSLITAPDAFAVLEDSVSNELFVLINDDLLDRYADEYLITAVGATDQGGSVTISSAAPNNHLIYTPLAGYDGPETFTYTVEDATGGQETGQVTVEVLATESDRDYAELTVELTGINDIPVLFGTSDKLTDDKTAINPFAAVTITDLDEMGNQLQQVTVEYDASFGTLSAPGMTFVSTGKYQILDTPASVTAALQAVVFTPFENYIDYMAYRADNSEGDVDFTLILDDYNLSVSDGPDAPIVDVTTVNIEPIDDAPTLLAPISDLYLQVNDLPRAILLTPHFADVDDDVPGGQLTWTVSGNTNSAMFDSITVDAAKQLLVINLAEDQFGVADVTVRATDRGLLTVETTFRISVDGPPVIELEAGETQPDSPVYISGSNVGARRDYRQSFVVTNEGQLTAEAFILHISGLDVPVDGISLHSAQFSSDENGTPDFFNDDTRSSAGVSIVATEPSIPEYAVKYDLSLAPGESVVIHLTYRASSLSILTIEPLIEVELTTLSPLTAGGGVIIAIPVPATGEVELGFTIEAGKTYVVQSAESLSGPWATWDLVIPVSAFDRELTILDDGLYTATHPSLTVQRFYRLVEVID